MCFLQNTNSYLFLNIFLDVPLSQLHKSESVEQIKEKVSTLSNTNSDSKDIPVVFVCRRGNDSQIAVNTLKEKLKDEAVTLTDITGGLTSWSKKIDPDFPTYWWVKLLCRYIWATWPRSYKTFFMLSSVEHEIFSANKYENWHFHIY